MPTTRRDLSRVPIESIHSVRLLKANGEDVKVVQESLRHATFQITMDVYAQAIPQAIRAAHGRAVEQREAVSDDGDNSRPIGPGMDPRFVEVSVSC